MFVNDYFFFFILQNRKILFLKNKNKKTFNKQFTFKKIQNTGKKKTKKTSTLFSKQYTTQFLKNFHTFL